MGNKRMKRIKAATLLGALLISGTTSADLKTGLIAHWSFDDCTAKDNSGNEHDGVIQNNPQCVTGVKGKAFQFNGTNTLVHSAIQEKPSSFTIAAWFYSTADGYSGTAEITHRVEPSPIYSQWNLSWGTSIQGNEPNRFFSRLGFTDNSLQDSESDVLNKNSWYFGVVTYDNQKMSLFLNGIKIKEQAITKQPKYSTNDFYIGAAPEWNNWFTGNIDEVRIYNRALSDAEATALYQQGAVPKDNPVFNSIKFIAETIRDNKIDDAISTVPNMVGFLANHPYFKNTKIFKIGINGKIGTQLQKQIREKFTGIDVTHMVVDEIVGFLIDATSDAVAKATNNRYYGGATWFLMKQMYSLADAYSTSKNSKGLVPLPVAFLSTQSSLLIEVAKKDIKEFITLQKDFSGAKASEIRGEIIRARSFDLLQFYQDYFRAETQEEKAIILNDIATRQEGLLQGYLSGNADQIFIPSVSKIAKRVYTDWLKHLSGSLIKEEFEDRARLHALVYYKSDYDTAISAATFIFGTPIFAIDLIREKAQTDEGANNYLIEHGY